jgi:probable F420-dependent oxidoreductase
MKIGWNLPGFGPLGTRDNILTISREAEKLDYHSLWVGERLLYPTQPRQSPGGGPWPQIYQQSLATLGTLLFVAGITEKVRFGTSTLNLPFHHPAHLAKEIATLDVLSNGRAVIAAGQGWSEDEYIASGVPFAQRTGRFVEIIHALNALWSPDPVEFHGKYYEIPQTDFNPKPIQKPRPPLLIAAFAPAAVERAARLADGFNPIARPTVAETEQIVIGELQAWQAAGREPAKPEIVMRVNEAMITDQPVKENRPFLTGSSEQVREDVRQMELWGVTEVFFSGSRLVYGKPDPMSILLDQMTKLRGVV